MKNIILFVTLLWTYIVPLSFKTCWNCQLSTLTGGHTGRPWHMTHRSESLDHWDSPITARAVRHSWSQIFSDVWYFVLDVYSHENWISVGSTPIHFEWASLNGFVILGNNFTFGPCASEAWGRLGQGIRQVSVRSDGLDCCTLKSLLTQVCPPPSTTWSRPGTSPSGTGWAWRSTGVITAATTSGDIRWWLESLVMYRPWPDSELWLLMGSTVRWSLGSFPSNNTFDSNS